MKRIILLVGTLFLLASCTTEFDQLLNGSRSDKARQTTVFQASVEGCNMPETKVYADENLKVLWNADDRISIFNKTTFNYQFAFTGDDGDTAGSFEEIPTSDFITGTDIDNIYAVYPYDKKNKLNNSCVLTVTLPSEQAYKESSFGIGANTMVAVSSGNFLAFKNVGGYLNLRLYGDDVSVSRITIKGNNGEKIAGKASIEMPLGGVPTVTMDNSATDEVSVICNPAVKIGADANSYTDFWFVIPPVYFSLGFTITVTDDKGGVFERTTSKALTINRNTLEWMAALKVVPDYSNANVPFEDENFKAYCVENFDKDGNGEISMAEAQAVTTISVNTENIASLEGIAFFSNLTELYCYGTITDDGDLNKGALTTLDVSNNKALVKLNCNNNQLTALNVSNCTALEMLQCFGNHLTTLDVSTNTALKGLLCWSNQLAELDVSHNASLENLMCQGNLFTSLDLTGADALSCLICHENRLTNLTFSQNRSLHTLVCYDNELSSLDVSNNVGLEDLECNNNQLTELDVSNNAFLTFLDCTNNPSLTTIYIATGQTIESLAKPESAQLVEIGSRNASFSRTILQYLLENYDADGNFILSQTEIDNVTGLEIEPAINNNSAKGIELLPHLQSLSCTVADFGVESEMTMLDVSHNPELKSLFIYRVAIESLDLSNNPLLETIGLQMVPLNELDVSNNPALTTLNFRSMHLDLDVSSNLQLKTIGFHEGSIGCLYLAKGQSVGCRHLDTYIFPSELILYDTVMYKGAMPAAFPDASFRSYVFGTFDLDGNGILSQTECDAVTEINVYTDNIASLTGIESFANLTRLTCKGSSETTGQLVSLDVSNLPSLAYLDCANNPLKTILARPGHTIQTICKPDDAVILSDLEKVLDNLLTATNNFLASCEAASQQASLSSSDALSIYNAMLDFAYAREPLRLYFNDVSGHDYFSYLLNNSMDYGSYNFAPLPYSLIDFDVLVNNSYQGGELIGNPAGIQYWNNRNSLQNIATQLFNSTIGSIFGLVISVGTGSVQAITDIEAALNADNYKAFYGVCKYDANTASIIPLN